jgi:hypothetical protein
MGATIRGRPGPTATGVTRPARSNRSMDVGGDGGLGRANDRDVPSRVSTWESPPPGSSSGSVSAVDRRLEDMDAMVTRGAHRAVMRDRRYQGIYRMAHGPGKDKSLRVIHVPWVSSLLHTGLEPMRLNSRSRIRACGLLLALCLSACAGTSSPQPSLATGRVALPTLSIWPITTPIPCGGVALPDTATLDGTVAGGIFVRVSADVVAPTQWPPGYSAGFEPLLVVRDSHDAIVARAGLNLGQSHPVGLSVCYGSDRAGNKVVWFFPAA